MDSGREALGAGSSPRERSRAPTFSPGWLRLGGDRRMVCDGDESPIDPALNGELGVHRFDARTGAPIDYLPVEALRAGIRSA